MTKSFGYSGKGVATYPNGDIYEGQFVNGVSIFIISPLLGNDLSKRVNVKPVSFLRFATVRKAPTSISQRPEKTVLHPRTNIPVAGKTIRRAALAK